MLTIENCAIFLTQESPNYGPEDLATMRRVFRRACDENPFATGTIEQRYTLAKAILKRYQPGLSETELISVALP